MENRRPADVNPVRARAGKLGVDIASMYRSGESLKAIGEICCVNKETIRYRLKRMGVRIRPKVVRGPRHGKWNGGVARDRHGYVRIKLPDHPKAVNGYVREHVLVAERALGKLLPSGAHVHHVNGDRHDNRPCNLVVCQDAKYHRLLHTRAGALAATGNADLRRCGICREWDESDHLTIRLGRGAFHSECQRKHRARRR